MIQDDLLMSPGEHLRGPEELLAAHCQGDPLGTPYNCPEDQIKTQSFAMFNLSSFFYISTSKEMSYSKTLFVVYFPH